MFAKLFKVIVLTLLAYLLQATVSQHISLWDVGPTIALSLIAVVTVALGRKYTFMMSLTVGYLLEIMLPELDYLSLILYPVCSMLGALVYSDKSERTMEEERSTGRRRRMLHAHLRTPLCAALSALIYEAVHLFYISLNGVALDGGHYARAFVNIAYTAVLAGVLQFPIRWWLGIYRLKKAR